MKETREKRDGVAAFAAYLRELAARQDRGALAALRRGLGRPPGTTAEMHPYVAPWLGSQRAPGWYDDCHYLVAALFGLHPEPGNSGDMGRVMRQVMAERGGESIEARFVTLLKARREDLADHLRQAVSLAAGAGVRVDYEQLLRDLLRWNHDNTPVQRTWARSFWGGTRTAAVDDGPKNKEGEA
jgi:CRISPR system Cascade subunit CasB